MSEATKQATGVIDAFPECYKAALLTDQRAKLGLHGGEDTTIPAGTGFQTVRDMQVADDRTLEKYGEVAVAPW